MSRRSFGSIFLFLAVFSIFWAAGVLAAERAEELDQDKDGRKETKIFYEGDLKVRSEVDQDGDGKPERWDTFDPHGQMKTLATDSNHDGKPDFFQEYIKGRDLVLREYDRNFDGKIDERMLMQWDNNKKLPTFTRGKPGWIPIPGYTWLWIEEDNDFDGKIDVYDERGNEHPSKARIGQRMQNG